METLIVNVGDLSSFAKTPSAAGFINLALNEVPAHRGSFTIRSSSQEALGSLVLFLVSPHGATLSLPPDW